MTFRYLGTHTPADKVSVRTIDQSPVLYVKASQCVKQSSGLPLVGTLFLLQYSYLVQFLPQAVEVHLWMLLRRPKPR